MKATIKIDNKGNITEHLLDNDQTIVFGRSSKCDVQIDDGKISGKHCRLFFNKDRLELTDFDSKNGTYLNGIRIEQSEIFMGDQIRIGDTIISLEEKNSDVEANEVLSFPGPFENRMNHELKADFTGARIQNQLHTKNPNNISHAQEIDLRKRIRSHIRLTKQELRARHTFLSLLASSIDISVIFLFFLVPFIVLGKFIPDPSTKGQDLAFFLVIQGTSLMAFFTVNFKTAKFTIGEAITGIKKMYDEQ